MAMATAPRCLAYLEPRLGAPHNGLRPEQRLLRSAEAKADGEGVLHLQLLYNAGAPDYGVGRFLQNRL